MLTVLPENRARTLTLIRSKLDHDLRSNLNVILGYCSMLAEDPASVNDPDQLADDLGYIASAGQDLLLLNNQVGDLLEIQQGKWKLARTELVVDYLVQDTLNQVSDRFPDHTFVLDGTARVTGIDARTTGRLLAWLLTQLCKATSVPCTIELNVEPALEGAMININCLAGDLQNGEKRKLHRTLTDLLEPVPVLNQIQDFDGYYRSVMCELIDATIESNPDELSCHLNLKER